MAIDKWPADLVIVFVLGFDRENECAYALDMREGATHGQPVRITVDGIEPVELPPGFVALDLGDIGEGHKAVQPRLKAWLAGPELEPSLGPPPEPAELTDDAPRPAGLPPYATWNGYCWHWSPDRGKTFRYWT